MCFSAPASFIASGGLAALGGASVAIAKKENKILAVVPLMFAVQQGFEGVQWLYLNHGSSSPFAGYGFLFFAFIVWPIYVPLFVYVVDKQKRKILKWFLFLGIAVGIYFLSAFLSGPVAISKLHSCVSYAFDFPFKDVANVGYLVAVFGALFASGRETFKWFGVAVAVLAVATWMFFQLTFASVWCFFAAVVSALFFVYLRRHKQK